MATEHELYRNAWQMLKTHGSEARREALRQAREYEKNGAPGEAAAWDRLAAAINEIAKSIPSISMH